MENISKLMHVIQELCDKEGISFYAKFDTNDEEYYYQNGGFVFDATDIIMMVQHWEVKNDKKLFPNQK